jgi:OFA family oxalate/formate antiporter-like MFS transporter
MSETKVSSRYVTVFGGLLVQVCLGSIYAWSFFQNALQVGVYSWPVLYTQLPFAAGLASFACFMVIAGRWQDRAGPRKVATVGGILLGAGYVLAWLVDVVAGGDAVVGTIYLVITYGIIGGAGIGFAYVCPIASLQKWFPDKKGTITGIAVAGFGAGALVIGYAEDFLLRLVQVQTNLTIGVPFLILGIVYLVGVTVGAQVLRNPPPGWVCPGYTPSTTTADGKGLSIMPGQMIRTSGFWLLWFMFVLAATAGLMVIGNVKTAATAIDPSASTWAALILGVLALFNAAGRIVWGAVSDRIGRENTMFTMFTVLAGSMFFFAFISPPSIPFFAVNWQLVMVVASVIGFCFGGNFSLFPSCTADLYGSKNVGKNYGVLFTAYGIAGILGGLVAGLLKGWTGSYMMAFIVTGLLAVAAALLTFGLKSIRKKRE